MINILEIHPFGNDKWVFFCDLFNDDVVTDTLKVDGDIFEKSKFCVETPKVCFSEPKARTIVLFSQNDYSNATFIEFL